MTFTNKDKMKALAIVHVFETSRPFGDYSACVVLNDGAGISYGINQFTHRSGSLAAVIREYLKNGGQMGREAMQAALPLLSRRTKAAIEQLAADETFKRTLKTAAITREMKAAQQKVAHERYLRPAIEACDQMGFVTALSLAVVYDSITHGSWELISARVNGIIKTTSTPDYEKRWITEYVRARDRWLTDIRRLRVTNYRTKFFLSQIAIGNWELKLPITVHGVRLTSVGDKASEETTSEKGSDAVTATEPSQPLTVPESSAIQAVSAIASSAAEKFDRVDGVVSAITTRRDSVRSLWTTVGGTISQAVWGVFGFVVGLPRTVWIVVAVIAGSLTLLYLYRQIVLGRIRETTEQKLKTAL